MDPQGLGLNQGFWYSLTALPSLSAMALTLNKRNVALSTLWGIYIVSHHLDTGNALQPRSQCKHPRVHLVCLTWLWHVWPWHKEGFDLNRLRLLTNCERPLLINRKDWLLCISDFFSLSLHLSFFFIIKMCASNIWFTFWHLVLISQTSFRSKFKSAAALFLCLFKKLLWICLVKIPSGGYWLNWVSLPFFQSHIYCLDIQSKQCNNFLML